MLDSSARLLGFGRAGASNWEGVGLEGAGAALHQALDEAAAMAGISLDRIEASVFGLGGLDWPSDVDRLEPLVGALGLGGRHLLMNDTFVALRAGTDRPFGIVVVAGSGTTVAGRNPQGQTYRTLGQGPPLFDDFGSANDVAERAVQAVARSFTGRGPATSLSDALREAAGAGSVAGLLEGLTRGVIRVPAAAPLVLAHAEAGDAAAREIVLETGAALGGSAAVAVARLGLGELAFDVVLAGGLFRSESRLLWDAIEQRVRGAAPAATLVKLSFPPVAGAGLLALEMAGVPVTPQVRLALGEDCARLERGTARSREG